MNLENIMLSKAQKTTYCMIPFNVQNRQIHRDKKETGGCIWVGGVEYWLEENGE